jgi:hypothetical protein
MSETIIGIGIFLDSTENVGTVLDGVFDDSAINSGTTTNASFSGSASNTGTVIELASFTDTAINTGTVAVAEFTGSASNAGTVIEEATFADTTTNSGVVSGTATFSGSAENDGGTVAGEAVFADTAVNTGSVSGPVVFSGDAVNNGTVAEAIFLGNSQNGGTVTLSATFAENAGNLATGLIQGDAVFADNTVNSGTIQGNAEIAATANGEQGTVTGSTTTYIQPDGAFAYGYFSGGVKAAAPSYATIVYQVGSFWYKYDASGNGALATGNYNDGTSLFTFANGVKGSAYNAPTDAPTNAPTDAPTNAPTDAPTNAPTDAPTNAPTNAPTDAPTNAPTDAPTNAPTNAPTDAPTNAPSNWYDDESASAHVVSFSGTQSSEGAVFDGTVQLTVPSSEDFAFGTGDFTIEGWVNQSNSNAQDWFVFGDSSNESNRIQFKYDGTNVRYVNSTNFNMPYTIQLLANNWYHVALSRTNNVSRIYINGSNVVGYFNDNHDYTANDFRIGDQFDGGNALSGKVVGVRVIKGVGLYTELSYPVPTTLPSATNDTVLLLNFGSTNVPQLSSGSVYYAYDEYGNPTMRTDYVGGMVVYDGPNV